MTFLPIQICVYNMTDPIDLNTNPKVDFIPNPKPTNIVIRVTWCMTLWLILMSREDQCMFTCLRGWFWELNPWAIYLAKNWNIYVDVLGDHHLEVWVINEGVYQLLYLDPQPIKLIYYWYILSGIPSSIIGKIVKN